jgi:photosystem II stability/assembly factor-like uncharacterized protein
MAKNLTAMILLLGFFLTGAPRALAHVPHDVVGDIKLSPAFSRDKTIFAIVRGTLFRSVDGGYEWRRQSRGLCPQKKTALAVSPAFAVDKTLFISCHNGGVYRSQDSGLSWVRRSNGLPNLNVVFLAISPRFETDRTILALGSSGDLYRSKDAGKNWERIFQEEGSITAIDWGANLLVVGTGSGKLYISEDNGIGWKSRGHHPRSLGITSIELPPGVLPDGPFFIGTEEEGVFRVTHGGTDFHAAGSGVSGKHITSLASLYEDGRLILFASTWDEAIFRSEHAGVTWSQYGIGLEKSIQADNYQQPHFTKIAIADDSTVFLGGFCGVFRSNDRGQSWHKLDTTALHIVGLDISPPIDSGFIVGISTYGAGMYSTNDGGVSWGINNRGLETPRLGPIAFSPDYAADRTIFSATYGHILKSVDGGAHWNAISVPPKMSIKRVKIRIKRVISRSHALRKLTSLLGLNIRDKVVMPLVFALSPGFSFDQTIFVGMYPNGILRSLDKGSTFSLIWDAFGSPVRSLIVSPEYPTDRTLFASVKNGPFRSLDGGNSWKRIGHGLDLGNAVLAISPQYSLDRTLFAGSSSGLFRTRDGGESWEKLRIADRNMGMPVSGLAISPFFATDRQILVQIRGGELYLCRDRRDKFEAVPSDSVDSGYEFSQLIERESAPLIKFSPSYNEDRTLYAASVHQLVKSTDGGKTWVAIPRPLRYESEAGLTFWFSLPISLEGQWKVDYSEDYSARKSIHSSKSHSEVTLRFVGTGVSWIGTHGPDRGMASVFIDRRFQAMVDQYSENPRLLTESFSQTGLVYGPHTITVKADGSRNEKSLGTRIDIDAFDVSR